MLNQESRARVEKLLKKLDNYYDPQSVSLTVDDFTWLAQTLIEVDDQMKEHQDCCLHEGDACKVGEELPISSIEEQLKEETLLKIVNTAIDILVKNTGRTHDEALTYIDSQPNLVSVCQFIIQTGVRKPNGI